MSWITILFCALISSAFAEDLDPIEVKASKDIERFTFSSSSEIKTHELEKALPLISDPLEKVSGVIPSQNGGPGGRVSYFIRGTEARHVSFTLDGLKLNDTSNTDRQFDAAFMLSPILREVNVYRGPQAVLYGSDAMGGLIELQSRKGENAPETRLNLLYGSFGTYSHSLSNDWSSEKQNGTLTWSRFHSDGISRINEKRFNADEKDATDITQLTSSSEHRWLAKVQTDLLFSYLNGKSEQDSFGDDNSFDKSRNDQYIAQQKTNLELNDDSAVSLRTGFSRHQRKNRDVFSGYESYNGDLVQHELIHRSEFNNVGIITGLSSENESLKIKNLNRSFDLHSAFLQSSFEKEKFKMHAGVRAEKHTRYGSFQTGAAGAAYGPVSLQYSQGFKAPSLYQLYGPDLFGGPVGNSGLKPETNHFLEASYKLKQDNLEGAVNLFQNRLSNLFDFINGTGYENQKRFIAEGIEFEGKIKSRKFETAGSFTHQQFRKEKTTVLRRPYNAANLSFSFFPQDTLELNATGRWFSSRKDSASGIRKLNGYEVLDLGIRKIWEKDEAGIQIKNILNREYEDIFGFSTLPRSIFLSYGHRFN